MPDLPLSDVLWLGVSFLYVFLCIGVAGFLLKRRIVTSSGARKTIHIAVSHWWLVAMASFSDPWTASVGPAVFIVLNMLSLRGTMLKPLDSSGAAAAARNYGTVYFPLSLLILVNLAWRGVLPIWQAGIGILVMGWGDGLAAVVGEAFRSPSGRIFGAKKSVAGTATMFIASFAVSSVMGWAFGSGGFASSAERALSTALFAAFLELSTPFGLDNLSVPLGAAFFYAFVSGTPSADAAVAGAVMTSVVAWLAHRRDAVTLEGALAGVALGTGLFVAGGLPALSVLFAFFASSTLLGRIRKRRREELRVDAITAKGSRRDYVQVLANCGVGLVAVSLFAATGEPFFFLAFAVSFAAATADTWASEIGVLNRRRPVSIVDFKPLDAGVSGGVSLLGFTASLLGALFIAALSVSDARSFHPSIKPIPALMFVVSGGFLGSVLDSLLGATIQAQYRCSVTGLATERPFSDGTPNVLVRGFRWMTNDAVNFLSILAASLVSPGLYALVVGFR